MPDFDFGHSPFPGMDPYLESPTHWEDFHSRLINALADAITEGLPADYFTSIGEHVSLLEPDGPSKNIVPDIAVVDRGSGTGDATALLDLPAAGPMVIPNILWLDPPVQRYIEIIRMPGREVVTVVEVLSPKNKTGDGRGAYLEKRYGLLDRQINLVELDLLRGGKRIDLKRPLPPAHYYALVSRSARRPDCEVSWWNIRDVFPLLAIPLRLPEPDVTVDLREAFHVAYERGRYNRRVDHNGPMPPPALVPDDAKWAAETVKNRGAING
jgi:hypothetical protein